MNTTHSIGTVKCPICDADGPMLRHDIRAVLVYSCQQCLHVWQIAPGEEPAPAAAPFADPGVPRAEGKRSQQP
jgi:hypothetical protein